MRGRLSYFSMSQVPYTWPTHLAIDTYIESFNGHFRVECLNENEFSLYGWRVTEPRGDGHLYGGEAREAS
jgi:hypothetical protein